MAQQFASKEHEDNIPAVMLKEEASVPACEAAWTANPSAATATATAATRMRSRNWMPSWHILVRNRQQFQR